MTKLQAKWTKENGEWCLMVRCGGRGQETAGQTVNVYTKSKDSYRDAVLGELVVDYGAGDVAVYHEAK